MYQTVRYEIKEGHSMYAYCRQVCRSFKNMYNVANFYIRQLLTGFNKLGDKCTPNERDAVRDVTQMLEQRNREPDRKTGKPKKQLPVPSAESPCLGYEQLNGFFVMQKNPDYYAMQANISQSGIKKCVMAWKSYYAASDAYGENPDKFKGKPRYPKYCRKEQMTAWLTNNCFSVKNGVLRLAGVDDTGGRNREAFLRDCCYKMVHRICRLAESRGVSRIAVGHTKGWKQDADMGKKNNQAFALMSLQKFICIMETVSRKYGIAVYQQEESYTSKADFLCGEGCMDSADAWNYRDFYPLRKKTNWASQPIA